jgi:hypothetical protein
VAPLTLLLVAGMIVAASTTLLADSRTGERGGVLPWALLGVDSVASLAGNVAVAQPPAAGRVIAAGPSFALIGAYGLLMRQAVTERPAATSHRVLSRRHDCLARWVTSARCRVRRVLPRIQPVVTSGLVVRRAGSFSGMHGSGVGQPGR